MTTTSIILCCIIFIVLCSILNAWLNNRREIAINRFIGVYDRMELYAVQTDLKFTTEIVNFYKSHKAITLNPEYTDIHVLLGILISTPIRSFEKNKRTYNETFGKLPDDLKAIVREFDSNVNRAVLFSVFKWEFMLELLYLIARSIARAIKKRSVAAMLGLFGRLRDLFRYEAVLASQGMQAAC